MAQAYLATKKRKPYYEIYSVSDCGEEEEIYELFDFTEEEMTHLLALREKYGKEDFFNHLDEMYDEDEIIDLGSGLKIESFDLDTEHYKYRFTIHRIGDTGVYSSKMDLNLSDKTYIRLLVLHLENKDLNINILKYADRELYDLFDHIIDRHLSIDGLYSEREPFTITMDEAREDAKKIREQHPDKFNDKLGSPAYLI